MQEHPRRSMGRDCLVWYWRSRVTRRQSLSGPQQQSHWFSLSFFTVSSAAEDLSQRKGKVLSVTRPAALLSSSGESPSSHSPPSALPMWRGVCLERKEFSLSQRKCLGSGSLLWCCLGLWNLRQRYELCLHSSGNCSSSGPALTLSSSVYEPRSFETAFTVSWIWLLLFQRKAQNQSIFN